MDSHALLTRISRRARVVGGRPPLRLRANLFGIPLGLAGLAQCWTAGRRALPGLPPWPLDLLWVLTAITWGVLTVAFVVHVSTVHGLASEMIDPTFGPFTAIVVIVPMMLGVALSTHAPTAGRVLFLSALSLTVLQGGWLSGQWIVADLRLEQWHPGYFLPTVAGGLVAAAGSATLGYQTLARLMFGYGLLCWIALGSIVLARLFIAPALPAALTPTLAIEVAPPVVAGNAWFAINGDRGDTMALALAGYGVLMVLVQVRLLPIYARLPFAPSWWAFSFSYSAAFALALRWVAIADSRHRTVWALCLLVPVTLGIGALAARTVSGLLSHTFLPSASATAATAPTPASPCP